MTAAFALPDENLLQCFAYLDPFDLTHLGAVSRRFRRVSRDNSLWRPFSQSVSASGHNGTLAEDFSRQLMEAPLESQQSYIKMLHYRWQNRWFRRSFDCTPGEASTFRDALAAVRRDPNFLRHASAELKNNRRIMMAAVEEDGSGLKFASRELRNDRDLVFTAIKTKGIALQ